MSTEAKPVQGATQAAVPATKTGTAVKTVVKKQTLAQLVESQQYAEKLEGLLPTYLPRKTFVQVVLTQFRKNPKLLQADPASFFEKLNECAERGLAPNGRWANILPFENRRAGKVECQLIVGYQGLAMLAKKYGGVSRIYCELWCKGDYLDDDTGDIHHRPDFTQPRNFDTCLGVVCVVFFKPDEHGNKPDPQGIVMPIADVLSIRDRAQSYKTAVKFNGDCPWMSDFGEMAKKTAFRRLCKWLDLSPEFDAACELDNKDYEDVKVSAPAVPIGAATQVKAVVSPSPVAEDNPNGGTPEGNAPDAGEDVF